MTEAPTTDFFDRLEDELRRAAARPARSRAPRAVASAAAVLAVAALALIPIVLLNGGGAERPTPSKPVPAISPVGTILPKGSGKPRRPADAMVVATGREPGSGPWQLEVSSERPRRPCLMLYLPAPPGADRPELSGYCGPGRLDFRKTPGFSRQQTDLPPRTVVIFGRAPTRANQVIAHFPERVGYLVRPMPAPPGFKRRFGFDASFYAVAVKRITVAGARVNWLDRSGRPGSHGVRLMPPLTPMKR